MDRLSEDPGEPHHLLGGRVRLRQPAAGLRAGLDAVMLAAACPARAGERVLDLGCGPGGVLLCILARVDGVSGTGVERDAGLAALARGNLALNGWDARGEIATADATALPANGRFDHAVCNPPWWPGGTPPPGSLRRGATHGGDTGLSAWVGTMARSVRPGGTAALVLPAALLDEGLAALRGGRFGGIIVWPLWPRVGVAAQRVVLRGRLGARGGVTLSPGMVLHEAGRWTTGADAVLRDGASLEAAASDAGARMP